MSRLTLASYQKTMGMHLRNPEQAPAPEHLNSRRLGVYRELVFNNIESQLASSFPVIKSILEGDAWMRLVREFLSDYRAQTPYFTKLSAEFFSFLNERAVSDSSHPFLLELAHYERIEIDLFLQDEAFDRVELADDHLSDQVIGMVSATAVLAYAFPVHRIAPEYQPEEAPADPTLLLLFQDDTGEVRFFELQPLAYHLVNRLQHNSSQTGIDMLKTLATELNIEFNDSFAQQGLSLLKQLNALRVLRKV